MSIDQSTNWLLSGTPSPTVDPSVHTILVGHSMGGIVAAEALLLLAGERPIPAATPQDDTSTTKSTSKATASVPSSKSGAVDSDPLLLMFPHVQGLLAFDTPFLGLAPEMIAHQLEGGHKIASSAYNTYNEVSSLFGWGAKNTTPAAAGAAKAPAGALPAPTAADAADAAASPKWQSWGKYAMFAGAVGTVAAGGAAALYSQREKISAGWAWAGSHLLFVGDLAKAERLRQRVENVNKQCAERSIGAANLYTNLGRGAREGYGITEQLSGRDRTFCNLPVAVKEKRSDASKPGLQWIKAVNEKAKDETIAHTSMFFPQENPGFYILGEAAKEIIASWIDKGWYESSNGPENEEKLHDTINPGESSIGKDWEGLDSSAMEEDDEGLHMRQEQKQPDMKDGDDLEMLEDSIIVDKTPTGSTTLDTQKIEEAEAPVPKTESHSEDLEGVTWGRA